MRLFAELKRRNVFRVALFYIVAAWVVIQVAETVPERSMAPVTGRRMDRLILVSFVALVTLILAE